VTYSYAVTNSGDTPLTVTVTDDKIGEIAKDVTMGAGAAQTFTKDATVSGTSSTTNVGTASGTDVLGKVVTATSTVTVSNTPAVAGTAPQTPQVLGIQITRSPSASALASTGTRIRLLLQLAALALCMGMAVHTGLKVRPQRTEG
jgi:hypothetical protein